MRHIPALHPFRLSLMWILSLAFLGGGSANGQDEARIAVSLSSANEIGLAIDPVVHRRYGVTYPLTFQFDFASPVTGLNVERKYERLASWSPLAEKSGTEVFNAVESFRIDQYRTPGLCVRGVLIRKRLHLSQVHFERRRYGRTELPRHAEVLR